MFGDYNRFYVPFPGYPIDQIRNVTQGKMIIQPSRTDSSKYVAIFKNTIKQASVKVFKLINEGFLCDGRTHASFGNLLAYYYADVVLNKEVSKVPLSSQVRMTPTYAQIAEGCQQRSKPLAAVTE
jgi:hypothetical protein